MRLQITSYGRLAACYTLTPDSRRGIYGSSVPCVPVQVSVLPVHLFEDDHLTTLEVCIDCLAGLIIRTFTERKRVMRGTRVLANIGHIVS